MSYPWQYDETVQVGTDYGDTNEVGVYDERMRSLRDVSAEVLDIRRALLLSAESTVWEIGTGTGECALALAAAVKHVYATDVSPAMLEYARRKAMGRHIANVTFKEGGFLCGFRPPHLVHGVVSQLALHHLPDFWKSRALAAIASSLHTDGRLYLRDVVFPSTIDDYNGFFRNVIDGVRAQAGDDVAEQTVQHIKSEYSTLDWVLEGMICRSGFRIVEKDCRGFLAVYVCQRQHPNGQD